MDPANPRRPAMETPHSRRMDISSSDDRTARRARRPTTSRLHDAQPPPRFSESRRDVRPCRFLTRTARLSFCLLSLRDGLRLHELEHEAIGLATMLEHHPRSIVLR